jgi:hypothetical protein
MESLHVWARRVALPEMTQPAVSLTMLVDCTCRVEGMEAGLAGVSGVGSRVVAEAGSSSSSAER